MRTVLLVGNFLSASVGTRGVCEELAMRLADSGWSVLTTSSKPARIARLADIAYRRTPLKYSAPVPGRCTMTLHPCEYDPIADLKPEILGAHFMVSDVYGGGFDVEDRRLIERLIP